MAYPFTGIESSFDAFLTVSRSVTAAMPNLSQVARLEARSMTYPTSHAFERGRRENDTIRSGKAVQSSLQLTLDGDYGGYDGQEDWIWGVYEGVEFLTSQWRKEKGTQSIHEDELDMMFTGGVYDARSIAMSLVDEDKSRRRRLIIDAAEKIEKSFWAAPVPAMEEPGPKKPVRSLPYFINEWPNGLAPGCTTQHGVPTPGAYVGPDGRQTLVCDQRAFNLGASNNTGPGHLFEVLSEAIEENRMGPIPNAAEYTVTDDVLKNSYPGFFTDTAGISYLSRTYRAHGELHALRGSMDAQTRTQMFDGKPFIQVPALKGAAIYPTYTAGDPDPAEALVTNTDAAGHRGPRYYLPKFDCIHHYFFSGKKFAMRDWYSLDQTNPESYVMHIRNKRLVHADRIKPHVLIYPGQDLTDFTA